MSWSELERLVEEAEADAIVRRSLRHCRSRVELVLASRRLGYRITRQDLCRAWRLHRREQDGHHSGRSPAAPRSAGALPR